MYVIMVMGHYDWYFCVYLPFNKYINFAYLSVCLFVCLFVSNNRQHVWAGLNFLWDITWPQGRFMNDQSFKYLSPSKLVFIKFLKILKINDFFCENRRIIFVLFYGKHKENMFTITLEDGCEALSKASLINNMYVQYRIKGK